MTLTYSLTTHLPTDTESGQHVFSQVLKLCLTAFTHVFHNKSLTSEKKKKHKKHQNCLGTHQLRNPALDSMACAQTY